jgi:hypothetical protein
MGKSSPKIAHMLPIFIIIIFITSAGTSNFIYIYMYNILLVLQINHEMYVLGIILLLISFINLLLKL